VVLVLRASGFFQTVDHPVTGPPPYASFPARFGGERLPIRTAGPTLGGDNRKILESILGLGADELARLEAEGVIGTQPANERRER
jgi:crotonobetainyl-CoA:carnitine CoA-transferase CaiB-like acyl-CoA transferase